MLSSFMKSKFNRYFTPLNSTHLQIKCKISIIRTKNYTAINRMLAEDLISMDSNS